MLSKLCTHVLVDNVFLLLSRVSLTRNRRLLFVGVVIPDVHACFWESCLERCALHMLLLVMLVVCVCVLVCCVTLRAGGLLDASIRMHARVTWLHGLLHSKCSRNANRLLSVYPTCS